MDDFEYWWYNWGSGLKPMPCHSDNDHEKRIAELAFKKGMEVTLRKYGDYISKEQMNG
jgi:hypothetical protein